MQLDAAEIERVFGLKARDWREQLKRNLERGMRPDGTSLAIAGYPELHSLTFYLTRDAAARWQASRTFDSAAGSEAVLITEGSWENRAPYLSLIGRDPASLRAIRDAFNTGDVTPPWRLFPEHDSYSGFWRQAGDPWMTDQFRPFWSALNAAERAAYLQRWDAPADWREFVELL